MRILIPSAWHLLVPPDAALSQAASRYAVPWPPGLINPNYTWICDVG